MEANDYKNLMDTIRNLEYEVIETRHTYIRLLSVCLLVYILGTLGCYGIMICNYFK